MVTWSGLTRREVVAALLANAALTGCALGIRDAGKVAFRHGVASGDPQADSVVIWTRLTSESPSVPDVAWTLAEDSSFTRIVRNGVTATSGLLDYSVKVVVGSLRPGRTYYYRFDVDGTTSPVGRTRTLPDSDVEKVNLAVLSCSHYAFGYFNVYREISRRPDLDAVIHLGDYIYESGIDGYGGEVGKLLGREHMPAHELLTLDDYRQRFAQYRSDPDLQAAHAAVPFIALWDDHETANDAWTDGAAGHDPDVKGSWTRRRDAALQAYFEWMPMREPDAGRPLYAMDRTYDFGDVASLHMIETRLTGRTRPVSYSKDLAFVETPFDFSDPDRPRPLVDGDDTAAPLSAVRRIKTPFDMRGESPQPVLDYARIEAFERDGLPDGFEYIPDVEKSRRDILGAEDRRLLSPEQETWLEAELARSRQAGVAWQILGNQTVMARMNAPNLVAAIPPELVREATQENPFVKSWLAMTRWGLPINPDSWDGYPAARRRLYDMVRATDANLLVLAGDTHNFWMNVLHDERDGKTVGVEFATSSVTSIGGYEWLGDDPEIFSIAEKKLVEEGEDVRYFNARDRGYILLELTKDQATAHYIKVDTVRSRTYLAEELNSFTVNRDGKIETSPPVDH